MKKIMFIFQIILKCSFVYLIAFVWSRYFFHSLWKSSVFSLLFTIAIEIFSYLIKKKKNNKMNLKIKEQDEAENMFFSLASSNNSLNFFEKLAKTRHNLVIKKKDYIIITNDEQSKIVLYPFITLNQLTPQDVVNIVKLSQKEHASKIIIPCYDYTKESQLFIKNFDFDITLLDKNETYALLYKEYQFFPEITAKYKKESKLSFKDLLAYAFNRSKTKGYILSAIIIFATSLFIKLTIFYCCMASILLLFALISYINPKYNKKVTTKLI